MGLEARRGAKGGGTRGRRDQDQRGGGEDTDEGNTDGNAGEVDLEGDDAEDDANKMGEHGAKNKEKTDARV